MKLLPNNNIDIVSVAVPDEFHFSVLKSLINYNLKLIIAEKPVAKTINEAKEILITIKAPIIVNYSRRFVPEFIELKSKIQKGEFGNFVSGYGYYGKGLLHNGTHMIDLIRFLIGEIKDCKPLNYNNDFYPVDASIDVILKLANGVEFYLKNIDCNLFSIFEADFIFEKARIKMLDSGTKLEIYEIKDSDAFKNYKTLLKLKKLILVYLNQCIML